VRKEGDKLVCASGPMSTPIRNIPSELLVNSDGFAYLAFTLNEWTLSTAGCTRGSTVKPAEVSIARDEKIVLWQIHPDGTYRSSVVEQFKGKRRISDPVSVASPSGAIIPDGLDGVLLAVRWSHNLLLQHVDNPSDELVYRIQGNGGVAYKLPLPKLARALHDDMVLGDHDLGFASRGGVLVAFNVRTGKELWRWDSNTPEISVYLATASGGCVVKTPEGVVLVENGAKTKDIVQGSVVVNWQGQWLRTQQ
jgi:outer membrane protein assembly factor BamB